MKKAVNIGFNKFLKNLRPVFSIYVMRLVRYQYDESDAIASCAK